MSQAAIKSSRPSLSLAQTAPGVRKGSRPNTPLTNEKTDSRSSTPKVDTIEESPSKAKPKNRASPRISTDEKAAQKQDNTNGKTHENGSNGNSEVVKKAESPKVKDEKKVESPKAKEEKKVETPKAVEEKKKETPKKDAPKATVSDDEMEALVVEPDQPETPKTGRQKAVPVVRVLTPRQGPPSNRAKPFQKTLEQEQSTSANLSTVSEQSTEATTPTDSPIHVPDRICGRRTTRPIKDIQLTYREKLNESTSSLNATVGSTIHNDSINTPYVSKVGGVKRHLDDIEGLVDSPSKRMHIDFSGFVSYVATPITMLKNRFNRVGINASTPRKLEIDEENIADISGTEAVSAAEEALETEDIDDPKATKEAEEEAEKDEEETEETQKNRSFCSVM